MPIGEAVGAFLRNVDEVEVVALQVQEADLPRA